MRFSHFSVTTEIDNLFTVSCGTPLWKDLSLFIFLKESNKKKFKKNFEIKKKFCDCVIYEILTMKFE